MGYRSEGHAEAFESYGTGLGRQLHTGLRESTGRVEAAMVLFVTCGKR